MSVSNCYCFHIIMGYKFGGQYALLKIDTGEYKNSEDFLKQIRKRHINAFLKKPFVAISQVVSGVCGQGLPWLYALGQGWGMGWNMTTEHDLGRFSKAALDYPKVQRVLKLTRL